MSNGESKIVIFKAALCCGFTIALRALFLGILCLLIASLTLATTENSTHKISKHEAQKISKAADTQRIDMLEYRANARNGARRFGASFEGA
ncbi:MAG: hypothetical protein K2N69_06605 [Helicobacter sp.]|nr:hypothetical protein [Helicobacter sp.]